MRTGQDERSTRFLDLLRPIQRELEVYCRRMIWLPGDAEDAVQNAVGRAFQAFDRYRELVARDSDLVPLSLIETNLTEGLLFSALSCSAPN